MDISAITKTIFEEARDVVIAWFDVLGRGPAALTKFDLGSNSTLLFALRFLFYVALVDFVVSIPSAAAEGVKYQDEMFIGASLAATYIEYLSVALILYGALKLFGGKARVQECVAGYCLLTAYLPVAAMLRLPTVGVIDPAIKAGADYPEIVGHEAALWQQLSTWNQAVFVLSGLLSVAVFVIFLINVFRCFRKLHRLSKARALPAFMLGLIAAMAFTAAFILPFDGTISRAFATK